MMAATSGDPIGAFDFGPGLTQFVALSESQKSQLRIAPYCGSVSVDRTGRSCISQAGLTLLFV